MFSQSSEKKYGFISNESKEESDQTPIFTNRKWVNGFANSIFQSSGVICGDSNWTEAARNGSVPEVGESIHHWDKFESDLDMMAKMGATSYRFSIEWSHVEPEQGGYNDIVLARYTRMISACMERNIEPMITLYHFNEPLWFTKLGGFEKEENIELFKQYAIDMFVKFNNTISLWCTINEPAVQAFSGYLFGQFPPHHHNLQQTLDVLTNLLTAHVEVYHALKQLPGGVDAQIGLVHNPLKFVPRYWWEPVELIATKFLTTITNNLVMTFLETGHLDYTLCGLASKHYYNLLGVSSYDFLGLHYYADPVIGFNTTNFFGPTCFPGQKMGDMYLPIDPQGFSQAIDQFARLGKPVYVTETGIADREDRLRNDFLQDYLDVIEEKRNEGVDLRGCYLWTFADNYEWNEGYTKSFGLFDGNRVKRKSADTYKAFMQKNMAENQNGEDAPNRKLKNG